MYEFELTEAEAHTLSWELGIRSRELLRAAETPYHHPETAASLMERAALLERIRSALIAQRNAHMRR